MFVRPVSAVLPGLFAAALFAAAGAPQAQTRIASHSVVEFASVKQGREILGNVDDYVSRMGSFDRMLRLKTARAVSEREFLDFAMDNVLSWTAEEKASAFSQRHSWISVDNYFSHSVHPPPKAAVGQ